MSNEKIYTIRITEAMYQKCGCPLCTVEDKLEADELERILGAAMMEPDVRIKTNEQGFCENHLERLLGMSNKLSLALMLQTHLAEFSKKLYRDSIPMLKNTPDPKRQLAVLDEKHKSCYVCARKREFMSATYSAFAYMYKSDQEFDGRMREQPYYCNRHMHCLLKAAGRELSKEAYRGFCKSLNDVNGAYAQELLGDLDWFCKKFDYRYKDEDWKNSKDSVERAVKFLK